MCAPSGLSCLQSSDIDRYYASTSVDGTGGGERGDIEEAPGIILGARVMGDWTKALNEYALREGNSIQSLAQSTPAAAGVHSSSSSTSGSLPQGPMPVPVQVMFDGPYGGCKLDLPSYERVLLVAGGSGVTFAVGVLDELVAACCLSKAKGKTEVRTERVDFVWCTKSFGTFSSYCNLCFGW
jgi:ferric-chelate reductase